MPYDTGAPLTAMTIDAAQFGSLEVYATYLEYVRMKKNLWLRIGDGGSISSEVLAHDGTIYFGACDHILYAVSADGAELWRFKASGRIQDTPTVFNRTIAFGTSDNKAYAFDLATGALKWTFTAGGPVPVHLAHQNGLLLLGCDNGVLYALDAATGKERWRFRSSRSLASNPLIYRNRIYHGYEDGTMYCLSLEGQLLWRFPTQGLVCGWPAATLDDTIFFGSFDENLYAVDATTGALRWRFKAAGIAYCPTVHEGRVTFGSTENVLFCLDAATGSLLWKRKLEGTTARGCTFRDGRLYTATMGNLAYCLDAATGAVHWTFAANGAINGPPALLEDRLAFGSWDCTLYCLDYSGRLLWKFSTSIATPSPIAPPEPQGFETIQVTWRPADAASVEERYKERASPGSYASFSSYTGDKSYVAGAGKDYAGRKRPS